MNRTILATLLAILAASPAAAKADWQAKALKSVKAEKAVVDAKWRAPETNALWVSMQPDGTPRDGFAQYLCLVLMEAGAPEGDLKTVTIYDPRAYETGGNALGMAACR